MFKYFYSEPSEQFTFYRIPKSLFTDEHFSALSSGSKILYGSMLDRMGLSRKNGRVDELNRVNICILPKLSTKLATCKALSYFAANNKTAVFAVDFPQIGFAEVSASIY